jgi:hypothetical protein
VGAWSADPNSKLSVWFIDWIGLISTHN